MIEAGPETGRARPPAPPPAPADVGLVAAMPIEVSALVGRFERVRTYKGPRHKIIEGECGGKLVALIVTGPGRKAARRGTQLLLDGHGPRWIVSAGFGGALDPSLSRNDVVLPDEILDEEGGRLTLGVTVEDRETRLRAGKLLTVDHIVMTAGEKSALRERYGADVVDMETAGVAALCGERNVRFFALRVVSDEAGVDLPPEILSIVGPTGGYRLGAAMGAVWRRPSSLKELWGLREQAHSSAERLAEVLPAAIRRLD